MTNKEIGDYDAIATPARTDLLLAQPPVGGLYKTYTPADVLGLLEASDVPDLSATKITSDELDTARLPTGTLTLDDVALDGTLRSVKDKDGNTSVLKLSTSEVTIQDMTVGLGGGAIATNVAIGSNALSSNTSGARNVGIGTDTLRNNTSGEGCIAIGTRALRENTSGARNVGIGHNAMQQNTGGYYNVSIGLNPLMNNTTGYQNVAIGLSAGTNTNAGNPNETSTQCVFIGADTDASADGVNKEIVIGADISGSGSNTVTIAEKPVFPDMPTSSSGLPSGSLYSDGGVIKIV